MSRMSEMDLDRQQIEQVMGYSIEFTAEELETLNGSLNAAAVHFAARAKSADLDPWIKEINANFRDETSALWLRVIEVQNAVGLRKKRVTA